MYAAPDIAIYSELTGLGCKELYGQRLAALYLSSPCSVEVHRKTVGLSILIHELDYHHLALMYSHHWPRLGEPRSRVVRATVVPVQIFDDSECMSVGRGP